MDVGGSGPQVTVAHLGSEDRSSFDAFYRREYRPLLRLAWSLTGRRDLGEELVQEVMMTVHRKWATVGGYERPGGFARRVLVNDATSAARRRASERRAVERLGPPDEVLAPQPPPDDEFWGAIRALPQRQAQAVALHYLDDRPIAEIADVLGVAANTVRVHLHRGRLALAESLRFEEENR